MHPSDFNRIPHMASCQYMDDAMAGLIDRWVDRILTVAEWFSPSLRKQRQDAKNQMLKELEQYDEYLASQAMDRYDDDVPW